MKMNIVDYLSTGEENAASQEILRDALGFNTTRAVRKKIEQERLEGYLIMSSDAGYFLPDTIEEMQQFVRMYQGRLNKGAACLQPARDFLEVIGECDPLTFRNLMTKVGYKSPTTDKEWEKHKKMERENV